MITKLNSADGFAELYEIPMLLEEGWNRHDMEHAFAAFADDAIFVNVFGLRWDGREQIVAEHAQRHATIFKDSILTIDDVNVRRVSNDTAIVHATWHMTGHASLWEPRRDGILVFFARERAGAWIVEAAQNTEAPGNR
jgi:uncharacterized protein (TIGR02246 family)